MDTIIPEISLVSLQNQSESDLRTLKEALNTHGFFTIIDHDIDDLLLDESYTMQKSFLIYQKKLRHNMQGQKLAVLELSLIHI